MRFLKLLSIVAIALLFMGCQHFETFDMTYINRAIDDYDIIIDGEVVGSVGAESSTRFSVKKPVLGEESINGPNNEVRYGRISCGARNRATRQMSDPIDVRPRTLQTTTIVIGENGYLYQR